MAAQNVTVFNSDDKSYFKWLAQNPYGFVINTPRSISRDYMVLHRATCSSISTYSDRAEPGGFTERDYIKTCSNSVESLRRWVQANGRRDGTFTSECHMCYPLDEFDYDYDD